MPRPPTISDDEILQLVDDFWAPFVTAKDLTGDMDMTRKGVYDRLDSLAEEGYLGSKSNSGAWRGFWLTEKGKRRLWEAERPEQP